MHWAESRGETGTKKLLRSFYQYFWASGTIKLDGDFGSTGGNIHGNSYCFTFLKCLGCILVTMHAGDWCSTSEDHPTTSTTMLLWYVNDDLLRNFTFLKRERVLALVLVLTVLTRLLVVCQHFGMLMMIYL